MLKYQNVAKRIRTNNALESLNGRLKKYVGYKLNLSWPEYMNLIINIEFDYKQKIIEKDSNPINITKIKKIKNKLKNKDNKLKIDKPKEPYFFKWHDNSCRFDSMLFIITFKLVNVFKYRRL